MKVVHYHFATSPEKLERGKRIELSALAWKAKVLPLYEPRIRLIQQIIVRIVFTITTIQRCHVCNIANCVLESDPLWRVIIHKVI